MAHEAKLNAVKNLRAYDHCFISEAGIDSFARVFGVGPIKSYKVRANPNDMKGLTLNGGAKTGRGMDAAVLASTICTLLDIKFMTTSGRGTQLRVCCDALEAHFSKDHA